MILQALFHVKLSNLADLFCSKVNPQIKATQGLAAICSALKYFGHVFVGVSRIEDYRMLIDMVRKGTMLNVLMLCLMFPVV
jgi:hypothetical protein